MCAALAASCLLDVGQLPIKPYCSDDLTYGLQIRPRETALKKKLIQINPPNKIAFLLFDIDREGAALAWEDANLPPPTWSATNQENGHAHLAYRLAVPVCTSVAGRAAPIRYLGAIEQEMGSRLRADPGYSGLITKNPLHQTTWRVWQGRQEGYSLAELAEYLPNLEKKHAGAAVNSDLFSLGRNCTLFDRLRHWAYRSVRHYANHDDWIKACAEHAHSINDFSTPLELWEVDGIVKSVSKWTWQNMRGGHTPEFIELQTWRGKKGGRPSIGEPWIAEGISRSTWFRRQASD